MRNWIFFGVLLLLEGIQLSAQVYNSTPYSTEDGLVQSQVWAILEDHKGFLWLGTHGGIARFDGRQFESYTLEDSITSDFITSLYQDENLNIWIGTEKGVACFDGYRFYSPGDSAHKVGRIRI